MQIHGRNWRLKIKMPLSRTQRRRHGALMPPSLRKTTSSRSIFSWQWWVLCRICVKKRTTSSVTHSGSKHSDTRHSQHQLIKISFGIMNQCQSHYHAGVLLISAFRLTSKNCAPYSLRIPRNHAHSSERSSILPKAELSHQVLAITMEFQPVSKTGDMAYSAFPLLQIANNTNGYISLQFHPARD